ncbi:MAG TPA: ThuA domain-containing protein [Opitutaceae bacterium]|nr:ThuA domain-containing protein [Opitutaceae bacterium]
MKSSARFLTFPILSLLFIASGFAAAPLKVMLLTGESNKYHDWTKSSPLVKTYLEQTNLFAVDVVTAPAKDVDQSDFAPKFSDYAVVVLDYETRDWPAATKQAFTDYVKKGGGLVTIHAADNAFPLWPEFNEMIGVGGWGMTPEGGVNGRKPGDGFKLRFRDGHTVTDDSPGGYGHPPRADFLVVTRAPQHPIMRGLPASWLQANDEIYSQLRGPAKNVEILATALADKAKFPKASGDDEPVLMAISYGKGRVFHTTLGHVSPGDKPPFLPLTSVGFIVTLQRGTEWAATGAVTQKVPADFPTAEKTSLRN